jgi:hypothetical protein
MPSLFSTRVDAQFVSGESNGCTQPVNKIILRPYLTLRLVDPVILTRLFSGIIWRNLPGNINLSPLPSLRKNETLFGYGRIFLSK